VLCIGCIASKHDVGSPLGTTINLDEVMERYGQVLAAEKGVENYYMLDDFKRRNALCSVAPQMAEEFGKNIVLVRGSSTDIRALTDALRPFAMIVIEGLQR
jgi:hypothetical protein